MNNIKIVTDKNMCLGCGACTYICPKDCIKLEYNKNKYNVAVVNEEDCIDCELCKKVCPSINTLSTKGEFNAKISVLISNKNKEQLRRCQSGGAITTIIESMLRNKEIEGALLTKFDENIESKMELVTDADKVIEYSGSKYCSTDVKGAIKSIEDFHGRVIVVGTPCQIDSIKRIVNINKKIRANIIAYIGLVCDRTMSYDFIDYILEKFSVESKDKIVGFKYRSKMKNGWPGDIEIDSTNRTKVISRNNRMLLKPFFSIKRCYYCALKSNPEADIVVGDPYNCHDLLPHNDFSTVIINTEKGNEIIEEFNDKGIEIIQGDIDRVRIGQKLSNKYKMAQSFKVYNKRMVNELAGEQEIIDGKISIKDRVIIFLLNIASNLSGSRIIRIIPRKILLLITKVINKLTW